MPMDIPSGGIVPTFPFFNPSNPSYKKPIYRNQKASSLGLSATHPLDREVLSGPIIIQFKEIAGNKNTPFIDKPTFVLYYTH
jgi:hypothetical protein